MNDYFSSFRTFRHYQESIEQNFDVSVVMPFYKKLKAFKRVFPKNKKYFERNGIEVIIVLDCPDEKELLIRYIQQYPFVNWKVIYNDRPHEWRNPTKPINVGIRAATKKYIMVCSPESEFYTDAILQMRTELKNYPDHYAIGNVCFAGNNELINENNIRRHHFVSYGSIMVEKSFLYRLKGYDETLNRWGGDDDNIRARLELSGVEELFIPEVKLIHRDDHTAGNDRRKPRLGVEATEYLRYPKRVILNDDWGNDFNKVIYDWTNNLYAEKQLTDYLSSLLDYKLKPGSPSEYYDKILLIPTYRERERIEHCLNANSPYFDAIIILDDESPDETYTVAQHPKLVLKIKKRRKEFNDLENRNILLNVVSFFKHRWVCFIDADEVLDVRYADFDFFTNQETIDSVLLNMAHLWDEESRYNRDYPQTSNGLSLRFRMFRNIGRTQILSPKGKLHFHSTPYTGNVYHSPVLIKHYGHLSKELRRQKYDFYRKEDTEHCQENYDHLINEHINKDKVENISIDTLQEAIHIYYK
ncbi:hypothetical protein FACS1894182_02260 [Bacteroidia bacterium]|nr:hypothetical protein FACS1894182_02260 [Bacteroidia bacterium]